MSYLRFDKNLMTNLEESLPKEILRTNRSGAYHCTTIVDCNTRRYHGLLVIPIPELDDDNHVLLSSLDEVVIQHGAEFNLGVHKYNGDNFSPKGHKYIREFDCEKVPTTIYRVGGVILRKEKIFVHYENRILIKYTLVEAHSPTTLRLKPFLAFRSVREYTHENGNVNKDFQKVDNGIKTCMYSGYPELYMQLNKHNEFHFEPNWYKGIEYTKEQERGYDFSEDLYVPGYFEIEIKKGESVIFSGGDSEIKTSSLKSLFDTEIEKRMPRDKFQHTLINTAHQFLNKQGDNYYLLAGYPWFNCRARDLFVSLPGLTLAIGEKEKFQTVMNTAIHALEDFMNGNERVLKIFEIDQPDVLLWAVWTLQQYSKMVSANECVEKYGKILKEIIIFLLDNRHPFIKMQNNGLLYAADNGRTLTWMNSTSNGKPIINRRGYIVETNSLWYNALNFAKDFFHTESDKEYISKIDSIIKKIDNSFAQVFLNEHGYLFDYVDGDNHDWSVRPNMIFTVAFEYSPLNQRQRKCILDIVTKELLTPKGIRTLSPMSEGYNPNYVGNQMQRDYAYHQGTAWPWLSGFYFEAYLRIYKLSGVGFVERQMIGFEDEMTSHCIGSIPELFDGNPPFKGRGAVSFAMNVAEILRILYLLDKCNSSEEEI